MGYYDQPDTLDATVSFTCSNDECEYENKDVEVSVYATDEVAQDVECAKCGEYNTVSLVVEYCSCDVRCVC
jgi:hypothetical protein